MDNTYRVPVLVLTLLLACSLPATAQDLGQAIKDPLRATDLTIPLEADKGGWYEIAPEHLPLSQLVRGLFPAIEQLLSDQSELRGTLLKDYFGIDEGDRGERALIRAVLAAAEAKPDGAEKARRRSQLDAIRAAEGDDASMRAYREHLKDDSRRLGAVWGQFADDMGGTDSHAMVKVRQYLERRRSSIGLGSDRSFSEPDHAVWIIERAFRQGMEDV